MKKPFKKEIDFTKDSILVLMQEIYNELVEQRNTAIKIQNKMLQLLKEPEDMITIGPVIEKQQKIVNDCVEKKLGLSKLQSTIWQKMSSGEETFSFSDLDENALEMLLKRDEEMGDGKYKTKK
jgi:hypothetical protein